MHFVHEGELTHSKAVGKTYIRDGDKRFSKCQAFLRPCRPVDSGQPTRGIGALDTGGNDSDTDGEDNGGEVNIAKDRNLRKTRWNRKKYEEDGGNNGEDDGADAAPGDMLEGDGACETMRAHEKEQLEDEHDVDQLIAKTAHYQPSGIRIIGDLWKLDLDLADDVAGIDSNQTNAHRADHPGDHAQRREGGRNGQTPQRDGLDDEDYRQTLPAQTAVFLNTQLIDVAVISLPLAQLARQIGVVVPGGARLLPFFSLHRLCGRRESRRAQIVNRCSEDVGREDMMKTGRADSF